MEYAIGKDAGIKYPSIGLRKIHSSQQDYSIKRQGEVKMLTNLWVTSHLPTNQNPTVDFCPSENLYPGFLRPTHHVESECVGELDIRYSKGKIVAVYKERTTEYPCVPYGDL